MHNHTASGDSYFLNLDRSIGKAMVVRWWKDEELGGRTWEISVLVIKTPGNCNGLIAMAVNIQIPLSKLQPERCPRRRTRSERGSHSTPGKSVQKSFKQHHVLCEKLRMFAKCSSFLIAAFRLQIVLQVNITQVSMLESANLLTSCDQFPVFEVQGKMQHSGLATACIADKHIMQPELKKSTNPRCLWILLKDC